MSMNLGINSSAASAGSGIDVTAVVNQILESRRAPEKIWQAQSATLTLQSSALTLLNSNISALADRVNNLKDVMGALTAKTVISSQTGILTATADSSAPSGNHSITVTHLATTSSYYTDAFDGSVHFPAGTLTLKVGVGDAVSIPVDDAHATTTLSGLVDYINSNNLGVTASAIHDANGDRLAVMSQTTGTAGDLTLTSDIPALTLNKIAGKNADLTVDGVPISTASNTVTGVLPGVTLILASASPGTSVQLNVAPDTSRAKQAVKDFVDTYNVVANSIRSQYAVDPNTNTAGALASDNTLRSLQASVLSDITYSITGNNGITGLASIGVNMNDNGTLTLDDSKLAGVLTNHFAEFQNFFQLAGTGFATHFSADLKSMTDATTGTISLELSGIKSTQTMLTQQINGLEDRLAMQETQLINEYSRIDTALREYPILLQQVTSQLATIPTYSFTTK
jgi:flagellar hook-associated protein 2